jgi:hypothetical protein
MKGTAHQAVVGSALKIGEISQYQEQLGTSLDCLSRNVDVLCPVADVLRRYLRIVESANSQLESITEAIEL